MWAHKRNHVRYKLESRVRCWGPPTEHLCKISSKNIHDTPFEKGLPEFFRFRARGSGTKTRNVASLKFWSNLWIIYTNILTKFQIHTLTRSQSTTQNAFWAYRCPFKGVVRAQKWTNGIFSKVKQFYSVFQHILRVSDTKTLANDLHFKSTPSRMPEKFPFWANYHTQTGRGQNF